MKWIDPLGLAHVNPNEEYGGGGLGGGSRSNPSLDLPGRAQPGSPFPLSSDLLLIPDEFYDRLRDIQENLDLNDPHRDPVSDPSSGKNSSEPLSCK